MHRYNVICKVTCANCQERKIINDQQIEANYEVLAAKHFKDKYRLCQKCLASGKRSAVAFDDFVNVEAIFGS
jgi:hypothetical protein